MTDSKMAQMFGETFVVIIDALKNIFINKTVIYVQYT